MPILIWFLNLSDVFLFLKFYAHSDMVLKSFGCIPIPEDDCVYGLKHDNETVYILKHVDDFGIISKFQQVIDYIKSKLSEQYRYVVLYGLSHRSSKSIILSQKAYIEIIVERYTVPSDIVYPSTPMEQ